MSWPTEVTEEDMRNLVLTRRIGVSEWRDHCGWRWRIVDHSTESLLKSLTHAGHKCVNETVAAVVTMVSLMQKSGAEPRMSKRDVKSAFRWNPNDPWQAEYCWVTFMHKGKLPTESA